MADESPSEFERVCVPLLGECYAFALSLARDIHAAEDLVQETYLRAFRAFESFEYGTNAKAWLFTILRRRFIDTWRRGKRGPLPMADVEDGEGDALARAPAPEVEDASPWTDVDPAALPAAVESLPDPFRETVRLRDLDGLTYREIAEVLDVPLGTVMSRLHRGREWLKRLLVPPKDEDQPQKPKP